jgi:hypothetical protein
MQRYFSTTMSHTQLEGSEVVGGGAGGGGGRGAGAGAGGREVGFDI